LRQDFVSTKEAIFTSLESLSLELQFIENLQPALKASQALL